MKRENLAHLGRLSSALLGVLAAVLPFADLAPAASIAELKQQVAAKQAEWQKAKNSLDLLQNFNSRYPSRSQRTRSDIQQLQAVRDTISTIHRNNLIKITVQLGVETAEAMKDACDVGQAATQGVVSLAEELLSNTLKDEVKAGLGLDTESLTTPITVKIRGLNQLASQKVPEIEAMRKLLRTDLHGIRGQEWQDRAADPHYDMTKPGNDPRYWSDNTAILIKLQRVKEALDLAISAVEQIAAELDVTKSDTDSQLPTALDDELRLRNELAFLQFQLNDAINAGIQAERDAAAAAALAALSAPSPQPGPVIPPKTEEETYMEYEARRVAAVVAEANAHVGPLQVLIDAEMAAYEALRQQYLDKLELWLPGAWEDPAHLGWLMGDTLLLRGETARLLQDMPTPRAVAEHYRDVKARMAKVNRRMAAIPQAEALLEAMRSHWQAANEIKVQVIGWVQMAAAQGVAIAYGSYSEIKEAWEVEQWIAELADFSDSLPDILAEGSRYLPKLAAQFHQLTEALLTEISQAGSRFQQAEVALAQYVATGAAADNFLNQSGWSQSYDVTPGYGAGTSGYSFSGSHGPVYRTLTHRAFWLRPLTGELLQALALPGEQGVLAFQSVMNRYGAFLNAFIKVNDAYHAKFVALRQAIDEILGTGYAGVPGAFSVLEEARGITPDLVVPASIPFAGSDLGLPTGSMEVADRMAELNGSLSSHWGLGSAQWLEEPSLDIPGFPFETHNPAASLLTLKLRALREIPTWNKLYHSVWRQKHDAWVDEMRGWHTVYFHHNPFDRLYGITPDWREQFHTPAEDQVKADADLLFARYTPIYDPPVISMVTPAEASQTLFPTTTDKVRLQVYTLSMGVSFQWFRSLNGAAYKAVPGGTQSWLDVGYVEGVQDFYCRVWNHSGAALSEVRSVLGLRKPKLIRQPSPASLAARTGATVTLTCALDESPSGGIQTVQWFKAKLDAAGKPIVVENPWGQVVYDYEGLGGNARISGSLTTELTITDFQPEDAGAYFVHVSNPYSYIQSALARVTHVHTDVAPQFLKQPQSQQALPGSTVSMLVKVNGSPPPAYQWKRNGVNLTDGPGISGAATEHLQLSPVQAAQSGSYTCLVTCGSKSATSAAAVLTVKDPAAPVIKLQPQDTAQDPGGITSFRVTAGSGFPAGLVYRWQFHDGSGWMDLPRGSASTLRLFNVSENDAGRYRCVVSNGASGIHERSVTSEPAQLIIHGLPQITRAPEDATVTYGKSVVFTGAATGSPTPTLQWFRIVDGGEPEALPRQTRPTLTLDAIGEPWASGRAFQIFLRATNRLGSTDSPLATLTVEDPFDQAASVGRYVGLVQPSPTLNQDLGGSLDLTVTKVGSLTGRINLGGKPLSFKGSCDAAGTADVTIPRKGLAPLVARLSFTGDGTLTGQLWQQGDRIPQDLLGARQLPWSRRNAATDWASRYTVALLPPAEVPEDAPQGAGYLAFNVDSNGVVTGAGKAADGTGVTLASAIWPQGGIPAYTFMPTRQASLLGTLQCTRSAVEGDLRWRALPASSVTGRLYPAGIGPLTLTADGGRYLPPPVGTYLLGMSAEQASALALEASAGGLAAASRFPFKLSSKHVATFDATVRNQAPKLTFSATMGTMTGSFQVLDTQVVNGQTTTTRRTATVSGVLLSPTGLQPAVMLGHFTLPGPLPTATTSPILGGAVQILLP